MRHLAALSFVCAAFAVSVPFLDRAGVALLGLAFVALALPAAARRAAPAPSSAPFGLEAAGDYPIGGEPSGVVERILAAAGLGRDDL